MKVAVLAWGSLCWNKQELSISSKWYDDGVVLPIEFARISKDGRLTLVISEEYGTEITTYWASSSCETLDDAIDNLRKREGTNLNGVGYVDIPASLNRSKLSNTLIERIILWAQTKKLDAVIWTDLKSNFSDKSNYQFNIFNAIKYLDSLEGEQKVNALEYIDKAPELSRTTLRIKLIE